MPRKPNTYKRGPVLLNLQRRNLKGSTATIRSRNPLIYQLIIAHILYIAV